MSHRHSITFKSILTSVFLVSLIISILISPVSALDETFTIPDQITRGETFYLCGEIPLDVECMTGTDLISYDYGSSIWCSIKSNGSWSNIEVPNTYRGMLSSLKIVCT